MEKVIVLNSGGFDSAVLIHYVKDYYPAAEIHSLHFSYGQRSSDEELKWSEYNAKKIGAVIKNITLPPFDWTKSNFYKEGYEYETQYLEWRNLVFLSYALSYAESIGADKIFCAFLKSCGYNDTSEKFLHEINLIGNGIKIIAPFHLNVAEDLISLAFYYKIEPNTFHSCDISNTPCGKCGDCEKLEKLNAQLKIDDVDKLFRRCGGFNENFIQKSINLPYDNLQLRIFWNNKCQLNCAHCYYNPAQVQSRLSIDEFISATKQALNLGISDISIAGMETLIDDSIFDYFKALNELRKEYNFHLSVFTNGINLPRYISRIKKAKVDKIFISVDDILEGCSTQFVRFSNYKVALDAINASLNAGINTIVFITAHEKNADKLQDILKKLELLGVTNFNINFIGKIGKAKSNDLPQPDLKLIEKVWVQLKNYNPININTYIGLTLNMLATHIINSSNNLIGCDLKNSYFLDGFYYLSKNVGVSFELFCSTYFRTIVLTCDGFILGCGSEKCAVNYDDISVGNIRDNKLSDLIDKGRALINPIRNKEIKGNCCFFEMKT